MTFIVNPYRFSIGSGLTYSQEVLADSPMLLWKLDETSGTTAADASGNGRTGTYSGTYTLAATPGFPGGLTVPYFNGGRVLGGATLTVGSSFTIEGWFIKDDFKTGQTSNINAVMGDLRSVSNGVLARWDGDVSTLTTYVANGTSYSTVTATTVEDTLYHYALTSNGTTVRVYLNGAEVTSAAIAASGFSMTWAVAGIWSGGGQVMYMMGSVGWSAVYSSALSATRIAAHYAAAA